MTLKTVIVGETERALLFKDKRFLRVLNPGRYRLWSLFNRYSVEMYDLTKTLEVRRELVPVLLRDHREAIVRHCVPVELSSREVGVVYSDRRSVDVLGPGETRLFWKSLGAVNVEVFGISEGYDVPAATLRDLSAVQRLGNGASLDAMVFAVVVPDQHVGILAVDGVRARVLAPGMYGFWRPQRQLRAVVVDTRLQTVEVTGQEMLTKDKVTLRINLSASYRVKDVLKAEAELSNMNDYLYREIQFGLREAVGQRTLDELLENKDMLNSVVLERGRSALEGFGFEVERVGVKDIILPGEMRALLNQVVEAEKAAQAQNIRRREETAATRSLHNTARMMEGNPVLLRLKELEVLEKVSEKIDKLTVFDGLEGVLKGLVTLPRSSEPQSGGR